MQRGFSPEEMAAATVYFLSPDLPPVQSAVIERWTSEGKIRPTFLKSLQATATLAAQPAGSTWVEKLMGGEPGPPTSATPNEEIEPATPPARLPDLERLPLLQSDLRRAKQVLDELKQRRPFFYRLEVSAGGDAFFSIR
jgi:hypothetical protein